MSEYTENNLGYGFFVNEIQTALFVPKSENSKSVAIDLLNLTYNTIKFLKKVVNNQSQTAFRVFNSHEEDSEQDIIKHYSVIFKTIILLEVSNIIDSTIDRKIEDPNEYTGYIEAVNFITVYITKKAILSLAERHNLSSNEEEKEIIHSLLSNKPKTKEQFFNASEIILNSINEEETTEEISNQFNNFIENELKDTTGRKKIESNTTKMKEAVEHNKSAGGRIHETKEGYEFYVTKDLRTSLLFYSQIQNLLGNIRTQAELSKEKLLSEFDYILKIKNHCLFKTGKNEERIIDEKTTVLMNCINIVVYEVADGFNFKTNGDTEAPATTSEEIQLFLNYLFISTLASMFEVDKENTEEAVKNYTTAEDIMEIVNRVATNAEGFFKSYLLGDDTFSEIYGL